MRHTFYFYHINSERLVEYAEPVSILRSAWTSDSSCILKSKEFLPPSDISRIYYLYTTESNFQLDFSKSTNHISPRSTIKTSLTRLAIVLIVIVSILSFLSLVLIICCLKRQLGESFVILQNCLNRERSSPVVIIDRSSFV